MLPIPRRYAHFVFGVLQSGLTSGIAAAIADFALLRTGGFLSSWLSAWFISWALMLPIVLFAAPFLRTLAEALTRAEVAPTD